MSSNHDHGNPASPDFSINDYLFYLLAQINSLYDQGIEDVLKPIGLNKTRWRILMSLREKNGSSISNISLMTSIKRSNISRTVDNMEKEGLIYRKANKEDNRITEVFLKDKGEQSLESILKVIGKQYKRAIQNLPEDKILDMRLTLKDIIANLKRSPLE